MIEMCGGIPERADGSFILLFLQNVTMPKGTVLQPSSFP